ncbi:MAG TPA: DNA cytosine methyltransferase [Planctomycetaceae bacterium]|nr:DNA cytosine methyltransferase [Planctomycetaceae bacterium]
MPSTLINNSDKVVIHQEAESMKISAVDLFCGVGGLTYGMQRGGIPIAAGVDIDQACQYPYEANNDARFVLQDVTTLTAAMLRTLFSNADYRVLVGCAPCQPFSSYSHGLSLKRDNRWSLLDSFGKLIAEVKPDVVSMENVIQLATQPIYRRFLKTLDRAGYSVSVSRVRCADFGVPQTRKRLVVLASLHGKIKLREKGTAPAKTVRDAIGGLERIEAGGSSRHDRLHCSASLSPVNLKRIRASRPGGTWHDWDVSIVSRCHRKKKGSSFRSVYGRMKWTEPSPTITTQFFKFGTGRFGHPEQDRALSLREGAILQTFPKRYRFARRGEVIRFEHLGRLIGNAVPVKLGEAIGRSILTHLKSMDKTSLQPKLPTQGKTRR